MSNLAKGILVSLATAGVLVFLFGTVFGSCLTCGPRPVIIEQRP